MTKQEIFDKVVISESRLTVTVADDDIFKELQALATYIIPADRAAIGDVVIVTKKDGKEFSFVVGKGNYASYEQAVLGLKQGENVTVGGESGLIRKISRIVVPPVTDETVRTVGIDGVNTVSDFKTHYINVHQDEIKNKALDQLYTAIVNQIIKLADPSVSEESIEQVFANEKQEYLDYCEGDLNAYAEELEKEFEEGSTEQNEAALLRQCKEIAKKVAVGKLFAEEDGETDLDNEGLAEYLEDSIRSYFLPKITLKSEG